MPRVFICDDVPGVPKDSVETVRLGFVPSICRWWHPQFQRETVVRHEIAKRYVPQWAGQLTRGVFARMTSVWKCCREGNRRQLKPSETQYTLIIPNIVSSILIISISLISSTTSLKYGIYMYLFYLIFI